MSYGCSVGGSVSQPRRSDGGPAPEAQRARCPVQGALHCLPQQRLRHHIQAAGFESARRPGVQDTTEVFIQPQLSYK